MEDHGGVVPPYPETSLGAGEAAEEPRRPSRPGPRQRRAARTRAPGAPRPAPDETIEAVGADVEPVAEAHMVEEAPAAPAEPVPEPEPEREPEPTATPPEPATVRGGGNGAAEDGQPKAKKTRQGQRARKKHGRR